MTVTEGILSVFKGNQLWTSDQNKLVCEHLKKRWSTSVTIEHCILLCISFSKGMQIALLILSVSFLEIVFTQLLSGLDCKINDDTKIEC